MTDELFIAVCWSSVLFGIFIIKKCLEFIYTSFGTLKYDCVTKTRKMLTFLPLMNSSVTIGLSFLLLIISAIISSKIIDTLRFFPGLYSSIFLKTSCISVDYSINTLMLS